MAFMNNRRPVLAICLFAFAIGTVSAACDKKAVRACLQSLTTDGVLKICDDNGAGINKCVLDKNLTCSDDEVTQEFFDYGGSKDVNTVNKCCGPVKTVKTNCTDQTIAQQHFTHTDEQCRDGEHIWTCSRKYSKQLAKDCHYTYLTKGLEAIETKVIDNLKTCSKNGYKVTVDLPGGAGIAIWSPVVTFVMSLAAAGFMKFQG